MSRNDRACELQLDALLEVTNTQENLTDPAASEAIRTKFAARVSLTTKHILAMHGRILNGTDSFDTRATEAT